MKVSHNCLLSNIFESTIQHHSFNSTVLQQVRRLFQRESSLKCDQCFLLRFPVFSRPCGHIVAAQVFLFFFSSPVSFLQHVHQKEVPTQDATNPVNLPTVYCTQDVPLLFEYHNIPHTLGRLGLLHPSPAPHFKTSRHFHLLSVVSRCQHNAKFYFKCRTLFVFFPLIFKSNLLMKRIFLTL